MNGPAVAHLMTQRNLGVCALMRWFGDYLSPLANLLHAVWPALVHKRTSLASLRGRGNPASRRHLPLKHVHSADSGGLHVAGRRGHPSSTGTLIDVICGGNAFSRGWEAS